MTTTTHYATTDREARDALLIDACTGKAAAFLSQLADSGDPEVVAVLAARRIYVAPSNDEPDIYGMPHSDVHADVLAARCLHPHHNLLALLDGLLSQAARDARLLDAWRRTVIRPLVRRVQVCEYCHAKFIPARDPEAGHAACKGGEWRPQVTP